MQELKEWSKFMEVYNEYGLKSTRTGRRIRKYVIEMELKPRKRRKAVVVLDKLEDDFVEEQDFGDDDESEGSEGEKENVDGRGLEMKVEPNLKRPRVKLHSEDKPGPKRFKAAEHKVRTFLKRALRAVCWV